jgi:hypothetical protein
MTAALILHRKPYGGARPDARAVASWVAGNIMIAAIIFTGLAGIYLVVRRKDIVTIGIGVVLLAGSVALLIDHMEWLNS